MLEGSHRFNKFNKKIIRGNLCYPCSLDSATDFAQISTNYLCGWLVGLLVEDKGDE